MNLAKLFKLPKKLGDSLLISLINNMVDYLRNYDSAIKVDDDGYIHLAGSELYLEGNGDDITLHTTNGFSIDSNEGIYISSGNEYDIILNSDAAIQLNTDNGDIQFNSGAAIILATDNQYDIEITSNYNLYLRAHNGGELLLSVNDDYRTLVLTPEGTSDGLAYRQNGDTYFEIDVDGKIMIKENDNLFTLQNRLTTGKNGKIAFLFSKDIINNIPDTYDNIKLIICGHVISLSYIKSLDIIEVDSNEYYYYNNVLSVSSIFNVNICGPLLNIIENENDSYTGYINIYNDLSGDISSDYVINAAYTRDSNNDLNSIIFTVGLSDTYITYVILNSEAFCYTADTLITLADGSTKQVKDITYDDELKVWNFDEGKDDVAKPLWIKRTEYAKSYQLVTLSDGNTIKLCGSDGRYHCMFDVTEQKFNHAVDCIGHEVYTENGIATVVSIEEVKEKVDHYNIVTNYHMNLYANHILTSTEKNNIYPIADMKFVKDDRKIVPYEEFEKAHISREYYDGWRAGEWSEPLKDVITHLRRRKMYAKPQKRVKDGLRTDYFG